MTVLTPYTVTLPVEPSPTEPITDDSSRLPPVVIGLILTGTLLAIGGLIIVAVLARRATHRAAETERRRIQQEIHDGLQQQVVGLQMQLETLEDYPELAPELVSRLSEESRILLHEVRAVIHGPGVITLEFDREVERAVESLQQARIPVMRKVIGEPWDLSAAKAHELAMIIREALTNIQKHAGRKAAVLLFFYFSPEKLEVEIVDTGAGFAQEDVKEGAGLPGMRERAHRMHGRLEVMSIPGCGTTIRVVIPR
jgi:signal transduction histidine kinase